MLKHLVEIFAEFGFIINWSPGKTEGLLRYRGKGAAAALESRISADGFLSIPVACSGVQHGTAVSIVECFKHLGGHINADGGLGN